MVTERAVSFEVQRKAIRSTGNKNGSTTWRRTKEGMDRSLFVVSGGMIFFQQDEFIIHLAEEMTDENVFEQKLSDFLVECNRDYQLVEERMKKQQLERAAVLKQEQAAWEEERKLYAWQDEMNRSLLCHEEYSEWKKQWGLFAAFSPSKRPEQVVLVLDCNVTVTAPTSDILPEPWKKYKSNVLFECRNFTMNKAC